MNTKSKTYIILISIAAVLIATLVFQVDWDARAVRKQLSGLVEVIEKEGRVSTFDSLARSRKFSGYFAENAKVEYLPGRRLPADKDALSAGFLSAWGQIETLSIGLSRLEVDVSESRNTADSTVNASVSVQFTAGEPSGDTQSYRIKWVKVDGDWLIEMVISMGRV